jgi:chemotaxis protein methyltransferase CheR
MTSALAPDVIERFRAAVAASTGLTFAPDRSAFLDEVLRQRMRATGCSRVDDYLGMLSPRASEFADLAKLLTVSETYFLRNVEQFRVVETYLGSLEGSLEGSLDKRLRVLSAGCSSGDEAYSAAIIVCETLTALKSWNVSIRAVDLNPDVLRKAELASYSSWSLRETPQTIREKYFSGAGPFKLRDDVRRMVAFERRNILDSDPTLWQPQTFHIVFCRNVLMYLTMSAAERVIASIARALTPGGLLFLGHAENLRGLSQDFRLRHSHGTFYYERRGGTTRQLEPGQPSRATEPRPAPSVPAGNPLWYEAIERSTARVNALTAPAARRDPPATSTTEPAAAPTDQTRPTPEANAEPRGELLGALELIGDERFADARALLAKLPPGASDDPDALLLEAVLLTCSGQPSDAERVCARLLGLEELNAGAHYVMALCREHAGDVERAIHHDQTSIYLDPEFAMPRLHLGRLLRRRGERLAARRELDTAASLLTRDDASRIVLFGGGFTRDGLIALCRAEQRACASAA